MESAKGKGRKEKRRKIEAATWAPGKRTQRSRMYRRFGVTSEVACSTDLSSSLVPPSTLPTFVCAPTRTYPYHFSLLLQLNHHLFSSVFHISTSNMLQHIEISFFGSGFVYKWCPSASLPFVPTVFEEQIGRIQGGCVGIR